MNKEESLAKYGEGAYKKHLAQRRQWDLEHPEKANARSRKRNRRDGALYAQTRKYQTSGVQNKRNKIRSRHRCKWRGYKRIIAPESQIHHEWVSGTSHYRGVALVEADQHMHGIIDVIEILGGEITLLFEGNYVDKK